MATVAPLSCLVSVPTAPQVALEGRTEILGDLLLNCTGLSSTITADILLTLNTNVTNQVTAGITDAMLVKRERATGRAGAGLYHGALAGCDSDTEWRSSLSANHQRARGRQPFSGGVESTGSGDHRTVDGELFGRGTGGECDADRAARETPPPVPRCDTCCASSRGNGLRLAE